MEPKKCRQVSGRMMGRKTCLIYKSSEIFKLIIWYLYLIFYIHTWWNHSKNYKLHFYTSFTFQDANKKYKNKKHFRNLATCQIGIYMFKVNNINTRTRCEICSKSTIKTPEQRLALFWYFYCYLWTYSHLVLVFVLVTLTR